jgi:hypothetical protein
MPSPTTMFCGAMPWWAARAVRRSWISGSPYFHTSVAAACIAAMALGEGPKTLSLAPMRARKGWPLARSCVSGPTKGTLAGREATRGVGRGPVISGPCREGALPPPGLAAGPPGVFAPR